MSKDTSYAKFFHPEKSPKTQFHYDKDTTRIVWDYVPKHQKRRGKIVWDSLRKGTYVIAKHGLLK